LADTTYPLALQGATASQLNRIWEVSLAGQAASSSSPTFMLLSRDSQAGTTTTVGVLLDAALDFATLALAAPPVSFSQATGTKPQRSSTLHLQNCSLNAFGGNYFWRANRAEECVTIYGSTTPSLGEVSLSAFTGGTPGAIGTHLIYEPL
jgi:hypothetical protein